MCGRKLKVLLLALCLLSLPLVSSYSEVVLTDQEYEQLVKSFETAKAELSRQENTIERQRETLSKQENSIESLKSKIEKQNQQLTKLEQSLTEASKSLEALKGEVVKSNIMWGGIGFAVGALGAGVVWAISQ